MNDTVPTVKIRYKEHGPNGDVFTINMTSFDPTKHDMVTDAAALAPLQPLPPRNEPVALFGSSVQPATWNLPNGDVLQLGTVVAEAHKRSGLTAEQWNALPNDSREKRISDVVLEMVPPPPPAFTVGTARGKDGGFVSIILDSAGNQFGETEYATPEDAQARINELTGQA